MSSFDDAMSRMGFETSLNEKLKEVPAPKLDKVHAALVEAGFEAEHRVKMGGEILTTRYYLKNERGEFSCLLPTVGGPNAEYEDTPMLVLAAAKTLIAATDVPHLELGPLTAREGAYGTLIAMLLGRLSEQWETLQITGAIAQEYLSDRDNWSFIEPGDLYSHFGAEEDTSTEGDAEPKETD